MIATGSEIINDALNEKLKGDYDIHICPDSHGIIESLDGFQPDALIINLCLPRITGLEILGIATYKPKAVIALTPVLTPSILDDAYLAGVGALIRFPCSVDCILSHLNRLLPSS